MTSKKNNHRIGETHGGMAGKLRSATLHYVSLPFYLISYLDKLNFILFLSKYCLDNGAHLTRKIVGFTDDDAPIVVSCGLYFSLYFTMYPPDKATFIPKVDDDVLFKGYLHAA